nr:protein kinase-like domain, concanavalin A-like lectin/glucanase domain protein [Tanacetum cinerariifolium]
MGKDRNITIKAKEEVEEESEEEFEEDTEKETEEEEEDDPEYFNTFPVVDELRYHEWLLKNPRPPWELGRVKGLRVFVGNFTYKCDFVMLEDTTSVIDHYLGGMVLGRPFIKETGLVYDKDKRTITLKKGERSYSRCHTKWKCSSTLIKIS